MKYLFSIYWKEYRIGFLFQKEKKYIFSYDLENLSYASYEGFDKLIGFPDINKIYVSDTMFPIFLSRIKTHERLRKEENFDNIDCVDYLISTKGKLVTDNIEIIEDEDIKHVKSL